LVLGVGILAPFQRLIWWLQVVLQAVLLIPTQAQAVAALAVILQGLQH
jgi:hypothetical protein